MRRKLVEKMQERAALLENAESLLNEGQRDAYQAEMDKVKAMNSEIKALQDLIAEKDRQFMERMDDPGEAKDKAAERGNALMKGENVKFSVGEIRRELYRTAKSVTLATGTLIQPTGAGSNIRDPLGNGVSSIVDQVYVQDLTGMGAFLEPYVITELDAVGGQVTTNAGKARTDSTSPTFGVAKISPYELNVTEYVDRNISRLSPANYYAKIYAMAMRALRRSIAKLIVSGDGQAAPDMYGILTAKNVAGDAIYATETVALDETMLDTLFFAYGSDEEIGGNARLYLSKKDLAAIGKLRNGDKQRVFKVRPEGGNPNVGTIEDGGTIIPYTIHSALTSLSDGGSVLYGDPMNYELGLFGDYSIRVDESIKGVERMVTILGDAMVGGNLVRHHGFVVASLDAASSG